MGYYPLSVTELADILTTMREEQTTPESIVSADINIA